MAINLLDIKPHKVSRDLSGYLSLILINWPVVALQPGISYIISRMLNIPETLIHLIRNVTAISAAHSASRLFVTCSRRKRLPHAECLAIIISTL